MAKIFAFPGPRTGKVASSHQAHSYSEPLVGDDNAPVSRRGDSNHLRIDWDNHELAGLYRVEGLLVQANIRILSGRGVSDEGDPWFVFCREDGDVFVHLARIDGAYLLDSPGLADVLHGSDFAELISRFVRQIAEKTAAAADNVVAFRPHALKDQTIRLHPSVMLAALVWSLYLASDDFIGAAQAMENIAGEEPDPEPQPSDLLHGLIARGEELAPELALLQLSQRIGELRDAGSYGDAGAPAQAPGEATRQTGSVVDNRATASAQAPLVVQGVAASLALIAVSYGFHALPELEAGVDAESPIAGEQTFQLVSIGEEKIAQLVGQAESDVPQLPEGFTGLSEAASVPTLFVGDSTVPTPGTGMALIGPVMTEEAFTEASKEIPTEVTASSPPSKVAPQDVKASGSSVVGSGGAAKSEPKSTASPERSPNETQQVLTLVNQYAGTLNDYQIGDLTVATTLDYAGLDKILTRINSDDTAPDASTFETTDDLLEDTAGATPAFSNPPNDNLKSSWFDPRDTNYDDVAQRFITQFIRNTEQIELVQFNMEIVLIDMTAIDDPNDIAHTRRWVTDDGHVISTIGHLQDFLDYGIA